VIVVRIGAIRRKRKSSFLTPHRSRSGPNAATRRQPWAGAIHGCRRHTARKEPAPRGAASSFFDPLLQVGNCALRIAEIAIDNRSDRDRGGLKKTSLRRADRATSGNAGSASWTVACSVVANCGTPSELAKAAASTATNALATMNGATITIGTRPGASAASRGLRAVHDQDRPERRPDRAAKSASAK